MFSQVSSADIAANLMFQHGIEQKAPIRVTIGAFS